MSKIISNALICTLLLQAPVVASEQASWYNANVSMSHNNNPNFHFLLGDWESTDPATEFKESWNTNASGDLFGYRSFHDTNHWEYDLFEFQKSLSGAGVNMRRMGRGLSDLPQSLLDGNWSAPINHRGEIKFYAPGQDLEILNKYDSPDPNTVNLQIQTTSKGVTTSRTFVLKRSAQKKVDPANS